MRKRGIIELILALGVLASVASLAQGEDAMESQEGAIGRTPPRLSFTSGEVSFWRPGAQEWSQAQVNTPLAPGDLLYTGSEGNLEIQIGSRAFVRGGPNTQLGFENQEPDFLQFKVTAGVASFDLRTVEPGRTVEVDTPNAAFTIEHDGYYRVDVNGGSTSFITRRGGQATLTYLGGEALAVEPSEDVVIEGTEGPQVTSYAAPQLDEWDNWNYARTDHLLDAVSARYVSPGVYGVDDLDLYGTWRIVPNYGTVWVPSTVTSEWVPYSTGAWVSDPYYGWTWVDTAPWGWAPFHYGRWVYVNSFWAWAPGPVVVRPAYAPALVAFFGGPGAGVSIGSSPLVGWVALGWGEPCVTWWGPTNFRNRLWWGGWGGPRVVDNVVIRNRTVMNVREIKGYHNAGVRNAVVVVKENYFGRGLITSARVTKVEAKRLNLIRNPPPVAPTAESFLPGEKRGLRPPEKLLERSVVATRPPQSRAEPAAGKQRSAGPERVPAPAPHIVSAPQHRETAPAVHRAPYGQRGVERSPADRSRPPAPPKMEGPRSVEPASPRERPVARQAPQQERGPQVTGPPPAESRSPGGGAEEPRPPARVLPGEPATRLSPRWGERWPQQRTNRPQPEERSVAPQSAPERGQRGRPGN